MLRPCLCGVPPVRKQCFCFVYGHGRSISRISELWTRLATSFSNRMENRKPTNMDSMTHECMVRIVDVYGDSVKHSAGWGQGEDFLWLHV